MKRIFAVLILLAFSTSVGAQSFGFTYTRVFASGTTVAKQVSAVPGVLHTVVLGINVSGPAQANVQVLDKATGCQQVLSDDPSIILEAQATFSESLEVDARFLHGLCVVVMSTSPSNNAVTVTWQ